MSQEEKQPEEVVETAASEVSDTLSKVHALQKRFYQACGELSEAIEDIGEPMYNLMLKHYFEQYKREYELMNAAEFIEVDKKIEELKTQREKEIEEVQLCRDVQKRELEMQREEAIKAIELEKAKLIEQLAMQRERELEEVKQEHIALTAEIERKREKLNNDIDILYETMMLEAQIKISRITPQSWRRFHIFGLHFGRVCKNEAMQYAEIAAGNEIAEYLAAKAQEVSGGCDDEEIFEPKPLSKREYKRWQKRFEKEQRKLKKERAELPTDEPENAVAGAQETPMQGGESDPTANATLIAEKVESD